MKHADLVILFFAVLTVCSALLGLTLKPRAGASMDLRFVVALDALVTIAFGTLTLIAWWVGSS